MKLNNTIYTGIAFLVIGFALTLFIPGINFPIILGFVLFGIGMHEARHHQNED